MNHGLPAPLDVGHDGAGHDHSELDQGAEGASRLAALRTHHLHRALVQLESRIDPFASDPDIALLSFDPDPLAAKAARDCARRSSAEEGIEDAIALVRAGKQDSVEES